MAILFPDSAELLSVSKLFPRSLSAYDADTAAAIAAVGAAGGTLTDLQKAACDTFILGLKAESIWSRLAGLYLFVGGTAGAHAVNWKTPGTHNMVWGGSPTHDSNGVTGDGATAYGDPGMVTGTVCPRDDAHVSVYCRTSAPVGTMVGALDTGTSNRLELFCSSNLVRGRLNDTAQLDAAGTLNAFYLLSRTASAARFIQRNATQVTSTTASTGVPSAAVKFFARQQDGSINNYTDANLAFGSIGNSLTTSQGLIFNTLVTDLQTALSRA